tara:strand:+ start:1593 stop:2975 length:1383 start_codon:yes stop_codon:yes gene_type:complete
MSTLNSEAVKTAYRKLVWYDSSTKKLMYSPADVDTQLDDAKISGSFTVGTISEIGIGSNTDKFLMSDGGVIKFVTGDNLRTFIGAGTSNVSTLNSLSDVSFTSGDLDLQALESIVFSEGAKLKESGDSIFTVDSTDDIVLEANGGNVFMHDGTINVFDFNVNDTSMTIHDDEDTGDKFSITVAQHGATTFSTVDDDAAAAHITINPDGNTIFPDLASNKKVQFQEVSTGHSLDIYHSADDVFLESGNTGLNIVVNSGASATTEFWYDGSLRERISGLNFEHAFYHGSNDFFAIQLHTDGQTDLVTSNGGVDTNADLNIIADGEIKFQTAADHSIRFDAGVGHVQQTTTYNAADTDVDFRDSNKHIINMTGNIADLNLTFPNVSGNFTLLLKQDGTGSRTIASDGYLVFDNDGNVAAGSSTVKFPGGTPPTLTTGANKVDIISFYYDAISETCYGVASLDF